MRNTQVMWGQGEKGKEEEEFQGKQRKSEGELVCSLWIMLIMTPVFII